MLSIQKEAYFDVKTLIFQRMTVIVSDVLLVIAASRCAQSFMSKSNYPAGRLRKFQVVLLLLLVANDQLILVDNIHFQVGLFLLIRLILTDRALLKQNKKFKISSIRFHQVKKRQFSAEATV